MMYNLKEAKQICKIERWNLIMSAVESQNSQREAALFHWKTVKIDSFSLFLKV